MILRQSTAVTGLQLGPFIATGGKALMSGLSPVVRLSKNNAAFAARGSTGAIVAQAGGWYKVPLTTTDTGTLGRFVLTSSGATFLPVWEQFTVVPSNVYDAMVSGTTKLNVGTLTSGAVVWTAAGRTLSSGASVWAAATRTLTSGSAVASSVWAAASRTLTSGANVWAAATRSLTDKAGFSLVTGQHDAIATRTWAATTRTLTSGGVVWTAGTRTLTSGGILASGVWNYPTRLLTSGAAVWAAGTKALTDKANFTLTTGQHDAIATRAWAASSRTLTSGGTLITAALTELAAVPAAAPQLGQAIMMVYQATRNKRITTATSDKVHTSATAVVGTAALSYVSGTQTFTRGKYA